jgi:hypothetical protein
MAVESFNQLAAHQPMLAGLAAATALVGAGASTIIGCGAATIAHDAYKKFTV